MAILSGYTKKEREGEGLTLKHPEKLPLQKRILIYDNEHHIKTKKESIMTVPETDTPYKLPFDPVFPGRNSTFAQRLRFCLNVKKETAQVFKDKCLAKGIPYSQVLHAAIEAFLAEE